jgi:methyl-accepting chemotaxis protein
VTQQNAAMVEESTAASHHLSQEATRLTDLVGQFKIGKADEKNVRNALKEAAPHAFRAAGKAPMPQAKKPGMNGARPLSPASSNPVQRKGNVSASASSGQNWDGF